MITDNIFYVGANDRTTEKFEALWPLPYGVSYNSYLVKGTSKTALIDGVEVSHAFKQLSKIKAICPDRKIDYLIINHMEPDHSGGIFSLKKEFPDMQIVGNAKTLEMLNGFYGISDNTIAIADGDEIDLGGKTLKFFLTPMLHWPETMMTYAIEDKVLFSGDAFGCFGALNGGIVDKEMDTALYFPEMIRYYSNIVGKYGPSVQTLLKKASTLEIDAICPLHGPIWRQSCGWFIEKYQRWSTYTPEDKAVAIVYGSIYGNTENAANILANKLAEKGVKGIRVYDASTTHTSVIVSEAFRCSHLVFASSTYNAGIFPPVETALLDLKAHNMQKRKVALLQNGSWAATSGAQMQKLIEEMKDMTILSPQLSIKSALKEEQLSELEEISSLIASDLS